MSFSVTVARTGGGAVEVVRTDGATKVVEANNVSTLVAAALGAVADVAADAAAAAESASAADASADAAASSASDAQTAQTAAELAETHAETAEANAETAQAAAEAAQAAAETAQAAAETARTGAETAETNAETAETNAEAAQAAAEAAQAAAEAAAASITLPIPIGSGGTGQTTAPLARAALGAAASGANTDITSVYLDNTGLKIKDPDGSHGLIIVTGSNLSADRNLTFLTGNASRNVTLSGNLDVTGTASVSGTNTGDNIGTSGATVPLLNGTNTWSARQTFSTGTAIAGAFVTSTTGIVLDVQSTDAGAGSGPDLRIYRNSASAAASDGLGRILFTGNDSGGTATTYGSISATLLDPTDGSEDASFVAQAMVAGSLVTALGWSNGVIIGAPTGTYQGTGTLNATALYEQGTALSSKYAAAASSPIGLQTLWIPAGAMVARTTNGAAAGTTESTTNKVMVKSLDFDQSTNEYAQFTVGMPKSWGFGTVTAMFVWSAAVTGNVVWGLQGLALSDDDVIDTAFGTGIEVTDGVTATTDLMQSATTAAITIGNTPAQSDTVVFQVYRNAASGSDTAAGDAKLIGVRLFYTTTASTDA